MGFWEKNFDKLMVFVLFLVTLGVAVLITFKPGMDEGTLDWARTLTTSILSLLAGLVGGVAIEKARGRSDPPDKPTA